MEHDIRKPLYIPINIGLKHQALHYRDEQVIAGLGDFRLCWPTRFLIEYLITRSIVLMSFNGIACSQLASQKLSCIVGHPLAGNTVQIRRTTKSRK